MAEERGNNPNQLHSPEVLTVENSSEEGSFVGILDFSYRRNYERRRNGLLQRLSMLTYDEEGLSEGNVEEENDNNIDFRVYPITIDWKVAQSGFTEPLDNQIIKSYGYLGLSLYVKLKNMLKYESDFFPSELKSDIIKCYIKRKRNNKLEGFVQRLPKLSEIHEIVHKQLFTHSEHSLIKLLLDLFTNYYENLAIIGGEIVKNKVIPIARSFYNQLEESEIKTMNVALKSLKIKKKFNIIKMYSSGKDYEAVSEKAIQNINNLEEGIDASLFLV